MLQLLIALQRHEHQYAAAVTDAHGSDEAIMALDIVVITSGKAVGEKMVKTEMGQTDIECEGCFDIE